MTTNEACEYPRTVTFLDKNVTQSRDVGVEQPPGSRSSMRSSTPAAGSRLRRTVRWHSDPASASVLLSRTSSTCASVLASPRGFCFRDMIGHVALVAGADRDPLLLDALSDNAGGTAASRRDRQPARSFRDQPLRRLRLPRRRLAQASRRGPLRATASTPRPSPGCALVANTRTQAPLRSRPALVSAGPAFGRLSAEGAQRGFAAPAQVTSRRRPVSTS
jgi:hypothetical protein